MEFSIIPDSEALRRCAWCRSHIYDDMEVFGFGAKLRPNVDLSVYEGHCIEIGLVSEERTVYSLVTAQGSEAKKDGKDCMFLVCSKSCGKKLKTVLEKEISIGEMFKKVWHEFG